MPEKFGSMLRNPEVTNNKNELEEALEAEREFFEYKFLKEESRALTDEVIRYFTYKELLDSEYFATLPEEIKEQIQRNADERKNKKTQILTTDFEKLIEFGRPKFEESDIEEMVWEKKFRREDFNEFFDKIIRKSKTAEYKKSGMTDFERRQVIEQSTEALKWSLLLDLERRAKINSALDEIDRQKVDIYVQAIMPEVRDALIKEDYLEEEVDKAKTSKVTSAVRSTASVSRLFNLEEDKVVSLKQEVIPVKYQPKLYRDSNKLAKSLFRQFQAETDETKKEELREQIRQAEANATEAWNQGNFGLRSEAVEDIYEQTGNLIEKETIPAYVKYMNELKRLKLLLENGDIVETNRVNNIINLAMEALKKGHQQQPQIVYFHGDFGTGKTALAKHISKTRFKKEPEIVAGSKFLEPDRFTEEYRLQKSDDREFLNMILEQMGKEPLSEKASDLDVFIERVTTKREMIGLIKNQYSNEKGGLDEATEAEIEQDVKVMFDNKIQGRYVMGAMYKAMVEGRPLIIDEANAISPEVLIAFNDLLTKRIGDKIGTRTDAGEIEIKPGYCIIFTGNSGDRFKQARFNDIDPSHYSRILSIKVDYLPQTIASGDSGLDELMDRFKLDELSDNVFADEEHVNKFASDIRERAKNDQIFQVLMLKLINSRMGSHLLAENGDRFKTVKDIYRLSVAARMIMDLFEGRTQGFPRMPNLERLIGSDTGKAVAEKLKKTNLSMRELIDNIIGSYLSDGKSMDIEWYIFRYVKSRDMTPEEQVIIFSIFQNVRFFEQDDGWEDFLGEASSAADLSSKLNHFKPLDYVNKYKKIEHNGDQVPLLSVLEQGYSMTYLNSLEVLQVIFGYLPALKKEHYDKVNEVIKKKSREKMSEAEKGDINFELGKMVRTIGENIQIINFDFFNSNIEEYDEFKIKVEELYFSLQSFVGQDLFANYDNIKNLCEDINALFMKVILEYSNSHNMSTEDIEQASQQDASSQAQFINSFLKTNS